mmetsp:Transcript_98063/g.218696  ORF Transcript_98063/g.218696 Transcript_98063/m.218696 type:complete len:287 (+) Transcript_98063:216-1076(+)
MPCLHSSILASMACSLGSPTALSPLNEGGAVRHSRPWSLKASDTGTIGAAAFGATSSMPWPRRALGTGRCGGPGGASTGNCAGGASASGAACARVDGDDGAVVTTAALPFSGLGAPRLRPLRKGEGATAIAAAALGRDDPTFPLAIVASPGGLRRRCRGTCSSMSRTSGASGLPRRSGRPLPSSGQLRRGLSAIACSQARALAAARPLRADTRGASPARRRVRSSRCKSPSWSSRKRQSSSRSSKPSPRGSNGGVSAVPAAAIARMVQTGASVGAPRREGQCRGAT